MEFGSLDGREGGEHNGVGFVMISKIFETQDTFFLKTKLTGRVYILVW